MPIYPSKYHPNYTPFGSSLNTRSFSAGNGFRFGFNTQEKDKEVYNNNETYTATFWEYDGRLGRRWNVDKITKSWLNSFGCFSNNPLCMVDHDGNADFYSQNGQKVGSDGNADGKIYILTSEEDVKKSSAIYFGTGVKGFFAMLRENGGKGTIKLSEFTGDYVLLPSSQVINKIQLSVKRTKAPTGDDKLGGVHEEGGVWGLTANAEEIIVDAKPGAYKDLTVESKLSIDVFDAVDPKELEKIITLKGTFHVHPDAGDKGMNFQDMSSSNDGYHISPTPSLRDVENATQGGNTEAYNIVIGMADNTVYFYGTQKQNQEGVNFRASFPSKLFFQLGKSNENEKK